jgi:hypothetical protein
MLSTVVNADANTKPQYSVNRSIHGLSNRIETMNAAFGFPATPIYAVYKEYYDATCETLKEVNSFLMNTCLADQFSSVIYSCG